MQKELIKVTEENYFSQEVDNQYLSNSQLKVFDVETGGCQARWHAQYITKTYEPFRDATPLIVGNYVGTSFESEEAHIAFVKKHEDKIFKMPVVSDLKKLLDVNSVEYKKSAKKNELTSLLYDNHINYLHLYEKKADYILADKMIVKAKNDTAFMSVMDGAAEQIFTCDLFGHPFKVRLDVWDAEGKMINDLKTCKDFSDDWALIGNKNVKVPFYEAWNYHRQLAVYRYVVNIVTGILSEYQTISAVTKQDPPDIDVIDFSDQEHIDRFDLEMSKVEELIGQVIEIKEGRAEPVRCEKNSCKYCRSTKVITKVTKAKTFMNLHTGV